MITFKFWVFIFCCLFEIKTFLLILQTFLTFATKNGADGSLPGCITRYPRDQICIPLRYFRSNTLVACHLQTSESESCESNTFIYIFLYFLKNSTLCVCCNMNGICMYSMAQLTFLLSAFHAILFDLHS